MDNVVAGIKLDWEVSERSRSKSKVTCKFGGTSCDREPLRWQICTRKIKLIKMFWKE